MMTQAMVTMVPRMTRFRVQRESPVVRKGPVGPQDADTAKDTATGREAVVLRGCFPARLHCDPRNA